LLILKRKTQSKKIRVKHAEKEYEHLNPTSAVPLTLRYALLDTGTVAAYI
jgi:hypothetical protein